MSNPKMEWIQAACIRALRTFAQTAVATIGTAAMLSEVNWTAVISASALAAILSLLMSLTGLPEASVDGTLVVDDTDDSKMLYTFYVETPLDDLKEKKTIRLNVEQLSPPNT